MRRSGAKRVVIIIMLIFTVIQIIAIQPAYFGVLSYFGLSPLVFVLPLSFICIVFYVLHLYQQWPLMLAWFKKSPDEEKQRDKMWRMVVLIAFMLVLIWDLAFGWYDSLKSMGEGPPHLESMRIWSWGVTVLIAIHVWQRWRLTFSYFRRSAGKKAASGS
jgi:hypothetical protein